MRRQAVIVGERRNGDACEAVAASGELFAAISLATWERMVEYARASGPCPGAECVAPGCNLAKLIVKIAAEVASE